MNLIILPILAVTMSAGNAEFERAVREGAVNIAIAHLERDIVGKPPVESGVLKSAMLKDSPKHAQTAESERLCGEVYSNLVSEAYAAAARRIAERMNQPTESVAIRAEVLDGTFRKHFAKAFAAERKAACDEQSKTIAARVRPDEAEFESKDEKTLHDEMVKKVAEQQRGAVFEENLGYISTAIVTPVLESARAERQRQREFQMLTRCDSYAPQALAAEIESNLRQDVAKRQAKERDPSKAWGVFPQTFKDNIAETIEKRTVNRAVRAVDDVKLEVSVENMTKTMAEDPAAHVKMSESEKIFRTVYAAEILSGAISIAAREAPANERDEFVAYLREHSTAPKLVKEIESHVRRDVLPKWRTARSEFALAESKRIWPTLADRTWYPDAELADRIAARSDFDAAVRAWRTLPEMKSLAEADGNVSLMEETSTDADSSVAALFALSRSAIAAQIAIVNESEPVVLGEARDRKSSFWQRTPDLKGIIAMLTAEVERRWADRRVSTLWGDGEPPANADKQHVALFPCVRERIDLVARKILEAMNDAQPEPKPEEPPPEEPPPEEQPEEPLVKFSITVMREGETVSIKLDQGGSTVAERSSSAKMTDYQNAMKFVSDKLGTDILKLK